MAKFLFSALLVYLSLKTSSLTAEETVGIEILDYNLCKNVDYAPITCIKFGEKYYSYEHIPRVSWFQALHTCRRNHGNLVTIESAAEMKALSDFLNPVRYRPIAIWTAGNDLVENEKFMSVGNGRELTFTNWATNQQNQPTKRRNREHCVSLQVENGAFAMFVSNCQAKNGYICELNTTIPVRVEHDLNLGNN